METMTNRFFTSIDLNDHPLSHSKLPLKVSYFSLLKSFAENVYENELTSETLNEYKKIFDISSIPEISTSEAFSYLLRPWRRKNLILLRYDLNLINCPFNVDQQKLKFEILNHAASICTKSQYKTFCRCFEKIYSLRSNDKLSEFGNELKLQSENNRKVLSSNCKRMIITANMSSGKSTMINAIVGKKIVKTAQEVCTGNVSYIYSKPFEDNHIHMVFDKPTINANDEKLLSNDWDKEKYIATYFNLSFHQNERWSLIDTPGVNSSMNKQHGRITRSTLEQREYDAIIHVLNAQQLGTDEEIAHLRWLKKHVQDRLIIFALNKLDVFNSKEDNIDSSMDLVRADLEKIGFENPIICPMSAYFAFLLKKKKLGACFTEDEQDEYDLYVKKFKRSAYDLSRFYPQIQIKSNDDEFTVLMKKCGFYGFEKVIFGAGKLIKQY